ncbi:hypothetical protein [Cyclobacterium qasimii]|uniref:Uncharacterized protein n=2 Tax=Cyclobacterium qasimii TaxID=1350429 RepID=S7VFX3_9BACT|nr:hypothetical protein [Cyclobacterium qasimii]EPR68916.1 hypothetical protein ADICYQ_2302 [Cyclobacterium qasimii M12-11B]GEO22535.1 hypothetical protein CQA01_30690 [Cyclobacterium qasimii]
MESKKEKDTPDELKYKIKNRESIAKIVMGIILFALVAYKLAISNVSFDFSNFDFTDLLSLTLAIFAIALSVAFYFKATDTSNKFYDNTFKFTKDISEILGRIEAGFGERLKHLDEGYSGLRDKFEGGISNSEELDYNKKELEEEKQKLEKEVSEKDQILSNLIKKAKLNEGEKEEVLSSLKSKEDEILNLTKELHFLKREIRHSERARENDLIHRVPPSVRNMIVDMIKMGDFDVPMIIEAPLDYLERKLRFDREHFPRTIYERLLKYGIITEEGKFTIQGLEFVRTVAKRM